MHANRCIPHACAKHQSRPKMSYTTHDHHTQRLLTQALMDANTYEEMEAEERRVLKKATEENEDGDVEYGAKVRCCVLLLWWCFALCRLLQGQGCCTDMA